MTTATDTKRRRFCRCSDQDYCARVNTYGMTDDERTEWLRQRAEAGAEKEERESGG